MTLLLRNQLLRRFWSSIAATLAITAIAGCGVWPFKKIFNGIIEGGSTVTNTSIGITYTIPAGYYQDKYEATTIQEVALRQHQDGPHQPGITPVIHIQVATGPYAQPSPPEVENPEAEALWWGGYGREDQTSHIRRSSWSGPSLPGVEVSYDPTANDTHTGCAVAVIGYPGHLIVIAGNSGGRPTYLPEVHDVAISAKPISPPSS